MTVTSNPMSGFAGNFAGPGGGSIPSRGGFVTSCSSPTSASNAFNSMVQQTDAHMCGNHLQRLVVRGQWSDALRYLRRFNSRRTVASNTLHFFLHTLWALANVAAGARNGSVKSGVHSHGMIFSMVIGRCRKLCSIVKGMVDSPQQCVALDSRPARILAGMFAHRLAREDPDLDRLMQLPIDGQMLLPHHILPIINPRPRRHVKRLPRYRAPAPAIARLYLRKRRSLNSSTPHTSAFMDESLDRVAGLVDECIKAGTPS